MSNIIEITPTAVDHIHKVVKQQKAHGFLFGVENGGCGGKQYVQELIDKAPDMNMYHEQAYDNGLKVYVSKNDETMKMLNGCKMDYVMEGVNGRLVITNPNAKGGCGCGKSFNS
jgi:iron-sulfur cluster assembly protein